MKRFLIPSLAALALTIASFATAQEMQSSVESVGEGATSPKVEKAPAGDVYAVFVTTMGNFVAKLEMEKAPNTAANFKGLAEGSKEFKDPKTGEWVKRPYYDGLIFHRVAKNFVIQGGCPQGNGMGGPGFSIDLEIHPDLRHTKGALSMARSQNPNSAGSQFFVTLAPTPPLDNGYAVFGYVVEGQDVVDAIGRVKIVPSRMGPTDGRPVDPITMKHVIIVEGDEAAYKAKLAEIAGAEAAAAPAAEAASE